MPTPKSIRETILEAIAANLVGVGAPAGLKVFRYKTRPIENTDLPAIIVYSEDDEPKNPQGQTYPPYIERQLVIFLEYRALASLAVAPEAALDPLIVWGTQTMVAAERFGGLASGVVEGKTAWMSKEGDQLFAAASTQWIVHYRTSRLDPTSRT